MRMTTLIVAATVAALAGSAFAQPPAGAGGPGGFGGGAGFGGRGGAGGFGGQALTPQQLEDIFKKADANSDSKLDKTELGAAITAQRAAQTAALAAAAQSAGITIPEGLAGRGGAAGPMTPEQLDMQLTRYDTNKDGSVSLEEWKSPPAPARGGGRGAGGPPAG